MLFKKVNRTSSNGVGTGIEITLLNDDIFSISNLKLRSNCPCASCLGKRGDSTHNNPLTPSKGKSLLKVVKSTTEEETNLEKIWLLGNYALGMRWADGHDSGIYTFEFLKSLSQN